LKKSLNVALVFFASLCAHGNELEDFINDLEAAESSMANIHFHWEEIHDLNLDFPESKDVLRRESRIERTYHDNKVRAHHFNEDIMGDGTVGATDVLLVFDGVATLSMTSSLEGKIADGLLNHPSVSGWPHALFFGLTETIGARKLSEYLQNPESKRSEIRWYVSYVGAFDEPNGKVHRISLTTYNPNAPEEKASALGNKQVKRVLEFNTKKGLWPAKFTVFSVDSSSGTESIEYYREATKWKEIDGFIVATEYVQTQVSLTPDFGTTRRFKLKQLDSEPEFGSDHFRIEFPEEAKIYFTDSDGALVTDLSDANIALLNDLNIDESRITMDTGGTSYEQMLIYANRSKWLANSSSVIYVVFIGVAAAIFGGLLVAFKRMT